MVPLGNSARSMPNALTSGSSELGGCNARGIIASEVRRDAGHTRFIRLTKAPELASVHFSGTLVFFQSITSPRCSTPQTD